MRGEWVEGWRREGLAAVQKEAGICGSLCFLCQAQLHLTSEASKRAKMGTPQDKAGSSILTRAAS